MGNISQKAITFFVINTCILAVSAYCYAQFPPPQATTSAMGEMFKNEEATRERQFRAKEKEKSGESDVEVLLPSYNNGIILKKDIKENSRDK